MSRLILLAAFLLAPLPGMAQGQPYPNKPIAFVVPYSAGGGMDFLIRAFTQAYSVSLGSPVVVDFKPGGNSIIGTEYVARSVPDGYTLLVSTASFVSNAFLYAKLPYDIMTDLAPVSGMMRTGFAIAVGPSLTVRNARELIELARSRPGKLSYASAGIGSGPHLVMEMLQSVTGITLLHVPYKGSSQSQNDLNSGRVDMFVTSGGSLIGYSKTGKMRVIALTTSKRSAVYPDVETVAESAGLPGFDAAGWWGVHAPAGVPRDIVEKLNADIRRIVGDASFRAKYLDPRGEEPLVMTVPQFDAFVKAEAATWSKVIRDAKVRLE
jgi:tripartite-type tricarboxylate transporter receptor subunit TctC